MIFTNNKKISQKRHKMSQDFKINLQRLRFMEMLNVKSRFVCVCTEHHIHASGVHGYCHIHTLPVLVTRRNSIILTVY